MKQGWLLALCVGALALGACNLPHPKVPSARKDEKAAKKDGESPLAVATEDSVLKRRNEKGELLVVAHSDSSTTSIDLKKPGKGNSVMAGVKGELYRKGAVISRFSAPQGRFIEEEKVMWLEGGVTIVSEEKELTLTASTIRWKEATGLISAEGNVWLKGKDFESGPAATLVTTPDLERFGTPDRFK